MPQPSTPARPPGLALRPATLADTGLLAEMHARSRASAYRGMLPDAYLDAQVHAEALAHWPAKMQALAAGAGEAWVAELQGEAIGFVCLVGPDEQGSVLVDNLHALPDRKRSGAGSALLDTARQRALARGAKSLHLFVLEANTAAIGFYESRGWRLAGRKNDTMGGVAVVALRYVLPLDDVA